jgi:hypothetical protein
MTASTLAQHVLSESRDKVDSANDVGMRDQINRLTERVERPETSVHDLSVSVEKGFRAVDEAFDEHRKCADFAFANFKASMDAGFARMDAGSVRTDARFDQLERKLDQFIDVQLRTSQLVESRMLRLDR